MPTPLRSSRATIIIVALVSAGTLLTFGAVAPSGSFIDEYDAIRGAQVMAAGGILHLDYFTHHMPLMYVLLTPVLWLFGTDLAALRIVFALALGVWLLAMSRHLWRAWGLWVGCAFVAMVGGAFLLGWYNQMMAESVIAWSTAHAVILFITRRETTRRFGVRLAVMVLLATLPTLLALAYLPVSAVLGALAITVAVERRQSLKPVAWAGAAAALTIPTALLVLYFAIAGALDDAVFQEFTFNTEYYSQINEAAPSGLVEVALTIPRVFFTGLVQSYTIWDLGIQPVAAIATTATLAALVWFGVHRRWRTLGWMIPLLVAAGSRGLGEGSPQGLAAVLGHNQWARHGETVFLVEVLIVLFAVVHATGLLPSRQGRKERAGPIAMTLVGALLAGVVLVPAVPATLQAVRDVRRQQLTIGIPLFDTSPATVINIVNGRESSYWVAPAEWAQQLLIESPIATRYPFYMDQVGICDECRTEIIEDIRSERPRVVYFAPDTIYGRAVVPALRAEIEDLYFEVNDPKLEGFLFLIEDSELVLERLADAGYDVR